MSKVLLDHDFCKITNKGSELEVKIKMQDGNWVLNRPFPADLRGQISALTLALDILSGKVILTKVCERESEVDDETKKLATKFGISSIKQITGGK